MYRKDCDSLNEGTRAPRRRIPLAIGAALAVGCMTQPAGGAAVRMWAKSVVNDSHICVADVAEVLDAVPEQSERYAAIAIKPAPKPGQAASVTLDELRSALIRSGANPIEFTVRGSVTCKVVRPLTLKIGNSSTYGSAGSRWWWPGQPVLAANAQYAVSDAPPASHVVAPDTGEITVAPGSPDEGPQTLEQVVYEFFGSKFGELGGRVHLRFSVNAQQALALSRPEYDFRLHCGHERRLGQSSLTVDILRNGQVQQRLPLAVEVSITLPVVVATRPINKGRTICAQDVRLEDRDFFHLSRIGLTELGLAVGQQTRRFVRRGEAIYHNDVKARPVVTRGDMVTVWSEVGGLRIKSVAKALQTGSVGETVEVCNESSRETFLAVVTGPQTVRVTGLSGEIAARQVEGGQGQ